MGRFPVDEESQYTSGRWQQVKEWWWVKVGVAEEGKKIKCPREPWTGLGEGNTAKIMAGCSLKRHLSQQAPPMQSDFLVFTCKCEWIATIQTFAESLWPPSVGSPPSLATPSAFGPLRLSLQITSESHDHSLGCALEFPKDFNKIYSFLCPTPRDSWMVRVGWWLDIRTLKSSPGNFNMQPGLRTTA